MPRKITLAVVWVVTTMGSMLVVGSAIGIVRDQVVDRPADLPDLAALGLTDTSLAESATTVAGPDSVASAPTSTATGPAPTTPTVPVTATSQGPTTSAGVSTSGAPDTTTQNPPSGGTTTTSAAATTTTTAAPVTTTTARPTTTTTSGPVEFSTHQLVGGWVRVGSRPGEVFLDGAGAAPGFVADIEESGPEKVSVEFSSDHHESEFQAEWRDGALDIQIDEKPESS